MSKALLFGFIILVIGLASVAIPTAAQDGESLTPTTVEIEAHDGLMLVGDLYLAQREDSDVTAGVVLLHMLGSERSRWEPLIPVLVEAYRISVLNMDMRGHGDTGGDRDWPAAEQDIQTAVDWLREQEGINADAISIVGASIGSNLALRGWSNDPTIRTAVALSPGRDYQGVTTLDAIQARSDGPVMLVAARQDGGSPGTVLDLLNATSGSVLVRLYEGNRHGTNLLNEGGPIDELTATIGEWITANSQ